MRRGDGGGEGNGLLIVAEAGHESWASTLGAAAGSRWSALFVDQGDSVQEILRHLAESPGPVSSLYVDAHLRYRECPRRADAGGLELLKHLRLTPELGPVTWTPVVVGLIGTPEWYARCSPDNVMLLSPGCESVPFPPSSDLLRGALARVRRADACGEASDALRPFVIFTENDEAYSSHDFLNRVGVARFLQEFAGLAASDALVARSLSGIDSALWLKKFCFQRPDARSGGAPDPKVIQAFRDGCAHLSFVHVDDERERGWSFGLASALVSPDVDAAVFEQKAPLVSTADRRFLSINAFEAAEEFFATKRVELDEALSGWSDAEERKQRAEENYQGALETHRRAQAAFEAAKKEAAAANSDVETRRQAFDQAVRRVQDQRNEFDDLALVLVEQSGTTDIDGLLNSSRCGLARLTEFVAAYDRSLQALEGALQRQQRATANITKTEAESKTADGRLRDQQRERETALAYLRDAENQLRAALPFTTIFLDLRLSPADRTAPDLREVTGIRLLERIRRDFPYAAVVMMTASEKALSAEMAREFGADEYWIKGVSSGEDLRKAVRTAATDAQLRDLWLEIQKVRHRSYVPIARFTGGGLSRHWLGKNESDRGLIQHWLDDSFRLLRSDRSRPPVGSSASDYPYDHILLNMGLVQERRFQDVKDKVWDTLHDDERELHRRRNEVAHGFGLPDRSGRRHPRSPCDRAEVVRYLQHTLKRLLA